MLLQGYLWVFQGRTVGLSAPAAKNQLQAMITLLNAVWSLLPSMVSMDEQLSPSHLIVLKNIRSHINFLSEQNSTTMIYVLLKKRQPYIDPDIDYEGLMVRKNAPR